MRIYLYLLAGLISALVGWNLAQLILTDWGVLRGMPEIVLYPCIAISLAVGLVANEICISSPIRPKMIWRVMKKTLPIAAVLGLLMGLAIGGLVQIIYLPEIPGSSRAVRVVGWFLIGLTVGLVEALTWQMRSLEAGDRRRYRQHALTSVLAAIAASVVAALLFEWLRLPLGGTLEGNWRRLEDPIGYSILGLLLGLALSITSSPSYMVALRAGAGFEYLRKVMGQGSPRETARIQRLKLPILKFISEKKEVDEIEEGLSIQLPTFGMIRIGSSEKNSNIYLPGLPPHLADIELRAREAFLDPNPKYYDMIAVNGKYLTGRQETPLKHNCVLTFNTLDGSSTDESPNHRKFYRFIFYNRFLDPQS